LKKEFPPRRDEEKEEFFWAPDFCECTHNIDIHLGFFSKGQCNVCQCPKYVRDKDLEGYYVEYSRSKADLSQFNTIEDLSYFKKMF